MADLNESEQRNVRTALRYLRLRVGAWEPLARALHIDEDTIEKVINGRRAVTPRTAFRVARFADVAIEDVLDGTYPGVDAWSRRVAQDRIPQCSPR